VVVRIVKVVSKTVSRLRKRTKPEISVSQVLKVRGILVAGEFNVPTSQSFGLAGLKDNESSRLLGTTGRRRKPFLMGNPLDTYRKLNNKDIFDKEMFSF